MTGHEEIQKDFIRLHQKGRLGHAYIFFGPESTGKFSAAIGLAAFLEHGRWPVEEELRPLSDMLVVSPDSPSPVLPSKTSEGKAGSIGIDAVRELKQFLQEKPFISPRRTAIVENAGAMTDQAQNALLKIAEEPPASGLLILTLTNPELLMPTLVSRFQKIYFGSVPAAKIEKLLREKDIPAAQAKSLAALSGGKPGLALRLAEDRKMQFEDEARRFLSVAAPSRKEFLKALLEPEDFSFRGFLDALVFVLAEDKRRDSRLWHAVLELRSLADATGLNPSIQLRNIWTLI